MRVENKNKNQLTRMQTLSSASPDTVAACASLNVSDAVLSLDRLPRQVRACVVDLAPATNAQDQELLLRLMEIGFLPGESVRIIATGFPGPDPLAVRVGQATFALRSHEAAKVLVQLEAHP